MFNLLRMDMYQIFKGKLIWIFAFILAFFIFSIPFSSWVVQTPVFQEWTSNIEAQNEMDPEYAEAYDEEMYEEEMYEESLIGETDETPATQVQALATFLGSNGFLAILVAFYIAIMICSEFNSGFIKNVYTARVSRASYFVSKAISIIVVTTALVLIGVAATLIFCPLFGLPLVGSSIGEIIVWILCLIGIVSAMSMLVGLVAWLTRSKVFSVVAGIAIVGGLIVALLSSALARFPEIVKLLDYSMYSTYRSLGNGQFAEATFSLPQIVIVAVGFFALYGILSYVTIKKRDV